MAHGRIVRRRRPNAYSNTSANSNSSAHADTRANSNTDPRPGMQRGSNLDRERDLYGRPAGKPERLHL
jgi:hypothetical protein